MSRNQEQERIMLKVEIIFFRCLEVKIVLAVQKRKRLLVVITDQSTTESMFQFWLCK